MTGRRKTKGGKTYTVYGKPKVYQSQKPRYAKYTENYRTGGYLGKELKFKDNHEVGFELDSTAPGIWELADVGAQAQIMGVQQGTSESQRIGRVYMIHSIMLKVYFNLVERASESTPFEDVWIRWALVIDTQTNGAQMPPDGTVFENSPTIVGWLQWRNLENSGRFRVLCDKLIKINVNTVISQVDLVDPQYSHPLQRSEMFTKYVDFRKEGGLKMTCKSVTSTVADMTTNSLHLIVTHSGQSGDPATKGITMNWSGRIRFTG